MSSPHPGPWALTESEYNTMSSPHPEPWALTESESITVPQTARLSAIDSPQEAAQALSSAAAPCTMATSILDQDPEKAEPLPGPVGPSAESNGISTQDRVTSNNTRRRQKHTQYTLMVFGADNIPVSPYKSLLRPMPY